MTTRNLRRRLARRHELPPPAECRRLREAAGLSLREVAEPIGVTTAAVQHWERGRRQVSNEHLEAYVCVLRILRDEVAA
jgi:DNA-binding transcriptional regulator YiaG